jgi:hypothetical protein
MCGRLVVGRGRGCERIWEGGGGSVVRNLVGGPQVGKGNWEGGGGTGGGRGKEGCVWWEDGRDKAVRPWGFPM